MSSGVLIHVQRNTDVAQGTSPVALSCGSVTSLRIYTGSHFELPVPVLRLLALAVPMAALVPCELQTARVSGG